MRRTFSSAGTPITNGYKDITALARDRGGDRTAAFSQTTGSFGNSAFVQMPASNSAGSNSKEVILVPVWLGVPTYIGTQTGQTIDLRSDTDAVGGFQFNAFVFLDGHVYAVWESRQATPNSRRNSYTVITDFCEHLFITRRQSIGQIVATNVLVSLVTLPLGGAGLIAGASSLRAAASFASLARSTGGAIAASQTFGYSYSVASSIVTTSTSTLFTSATLGQLVVLGTAGALARGAAAVGYTAAAFASVVPSAANAASDAFGTPRRDFSTSDTIQSSTSQADRLVAILVPLSAGTVTSITRISATNVETEELSNFTRQDDGVELGGVGYAIFTNTYSTSIQAGDRHRVSASNWS